MYDKWVDITIDISKLEDCQLQIAEIFETIRTFSVNDLALELYCALYSINEAIKWLKFFNGDIDIDSLPEVWRGDVPNIFNNRRPENLWFM